MYGYIKGLIKEVTPNYIILDNNGIGYLVITPNPYHYQLEDEAIVHIYQHVREDNITLYGFYSPESKQLFLQLISVKGIGPKTALSILATNQNNEVIAAIEHGDIKFLSKFPGIGPKSSQQIILDLKGKLIATNKLVITNEVSDAEKALIALGYKKAQIKKALSIIDTNTSVEDIIRQALKNIIN